MDLNRSSAFPDNINLVPPSQESALENQSIVSSSRIGNDGNGMKIEDVTATNTTAQLTSLRSALKNSDGTGSQKKELKKISFKEDIEIRTFVKNKSSYFDATKTVKEVETEALVKQKLNESRNRLSLFMSGIREAWANFTYYPKFTKVLALDESKNTSSFSKMEFVRNIRKEYRLNSTLKSKRLQARVERCVKRGDFEEVESMIKFFSIQNKEMKMKKDIKALRSIFHALKRLKGDASEVPDSPITSLLALALEKFQKN